MTSLEVSIKDAVIPVALANAALLITSPSLGCLTTYARALNDLCHVYSLPSPDLSQVIQYSKQIMMPSSLSLQSNDEARKQKLSEENQTLGYNQYTKPTKEISFSTSENLDERWEATPCVKDTEEPVCRIKEEYQEPMLNMIKQEVENYTELYMACREPPKTKHDDTDKFEIVPTNLNSQIRHYDNNVNQKDSKKPKVHPPDQNSPGKTEINPSILNDEERPRVHPVNLNTAVSSAVQDVNQNDKVRSRVKPVNHNESGQSGIQTAISLLSAEQMQSNAGNVMETSNEQQSDPITTNNMTGTQPKYHTLYSYLLPDGDLIQEVELKYVKLYSYLLPNGNPIEEVEMINYDIMLDKYWGRNHGPKNAVLKVITYVKGSKKSPWLYISIRENHDLPISFRDIRDINCSGRTFFRIYFSFIVLRIQCEASITATREVRSAVENKKGTS